MTWIPSSAQKTLSIRAPLEKVFAYLADPSQSGKHWGGIERIDRVADGKIPVGESQLYRWVLTERSTAGLKFKGDYVARFATNGKDEVTWSYVSGNMKSSGRHKLTAAGDFTTLSVTVENEADAPVPGLLKGIAKMFAQGEIDKALESFVTAVRRTLES